MYEEKTIKFIESQNNLYNIVDPNITITGWVQRIRNHGNLLFVDIRDGDGVIQCALDSSNPILVQLSKIHEESLVSVSGKLSFRPKGTENTTLSTGNLEIKVDDYKIINESNPLPFSLHEETFNASEEQRLKYRYLDLRRASMQRNLLMRSDVLYTIREKMHEMDFIEIQTPILTASSPEGARDYLVPARLYPGKFYALPQAPQIFKQLLMSSGIKKYFQIAPCFRDEAGRSDRSPGEFYQLDIEMAFASQENVFSVVYDIMNHLFHKFTQTPFITSDGKIFDAPFLNRSYDLPCEHWPINWNWNYIPYEQSLELYGTDKPDLRVDDHIIIQDITDIIKKHPAPFLEEIINSNGVIKCIPIFEDKSVLSLSGKWFKELEQFAMDLDMPGLAYFKLGNYNSYLNNKETGLPIEISGPLSKFLSQEQIISIVDKYSTFGCMDTVNMAFVIIAGNKKDVYRWSGKLRVEIAKRLKLYDEKRFEFCWITDFPMYELNEETGLIEFSHNPFSMPQGGMDALTALEPLAIKAFQYDLVCNGIELSSGALRNYRTDIMEKAFELAGYDPSVVKEKFPALYTAFQYGAPPSAGIAPGIDRTIMLLANEPNIREIIAFPMNNNAQDLMLGAPNVPTIEQLKDLHIKTTK